MAEFLRDSKHKGMTGTNGEGNAEEPIQGHTITGSSNTRLYSETLREFIDWYFSVTPEEFDEELLDAYLEEMDTLSPLESSFDSQTSLEKFHEKFPSLFNEQKQVSISENPKHRVVHLSRKLRKLVIVAAIIIGILGMLVTAQAAGIDVLGVIGRWTEENFHFSSLSMGIDQESIVAKQDLSHAECYRLLQNALDECGIADDIVPQWFPEKFQASEPIVSKTSKSNSICVAFHSIEGQTFSLIITRYQTPCYLKNDKVRMSSSSGAVFSALASYVFSLNGIVYGVTMSDDCYSAEFVSASDEEGQKRLRGSKYLQAKVGNTYKNVQADLVAEKVVLFTGTGCQINGLKNFLGKDYDNLICADVICHGVPSPSLWRKYVQYQEKKNGGKLKYVNFRCKDDSWTDYGMKEVCQSIPGGEVKKEYISKNVDPYMQMFLRDYCLRPSCYDCIAKGIKMSDLTIADFWGIQKVAPDMDSNRGISLVLVRTEKGRNVFDRISESMKFKEVSYEDGVRGNPAEYRSVGRPSQRDTFFSDMLNMDFDELAVKYAAPVKISAKANIKRVIKSIVELFVGEE